MIEQISIDDFKGSTGSHECKPLMLWRGVSGSGKSTWLEAVRVGILGYDPAVGKTPAATMQFMTEGKSRMAVTLTLPGEETIARIFESKRGRNSQTIAINGEPLKQELAEQQILELTGKFETMFYLDDFIRLSDDKKLDFLFQLNPQSVTGDQVIRTAEKQFLEAVTDAVPLILEFQFNGTSFEELTKEEVATLETTLVTKQGQEHGEELKAMLSVFHEDYGKDPHHILRLLVLACNDELRMAQARKREAQAANRKLTEQATVSPQGTEHEAASSLATAQAQRLQLREQIAAQEALMEASEKQAKAMSSLRVKIANLETNRDALGDITPSTLAGVETQLEMTKASISNHAERVEGLYENQTNVQAQRNSLEHQIQAWRKVLTGLSEITWSVHCPQCDHPFDASPEADLKVSEHEQDLAPLDAELKDIHQQLEDAQKESRMWLEQQDRLDKDKKTLTRHQSLTEDIGSFTETLAELEAGFQAIDLTSELDLKRKHLTGVEEDIVKATKVLQEFQVVKSAEMALRESAASIEGHEARIQYAKQALSAARALRNRYTADGVGSMEAVANDLLAAVDTKLRLFYDIGESGEFGIRCVNLNGATVSFVTLSGGEKVLYSCAQVLALISQANPPVKVLQAELGELSGNYVPFLLESVATMVGDLDVQCMFSSCHSDFTTPDEWHTVNCIGDDLGAAAIRAC